MKTVDELKQLVEAQPCQWQLSQDVFDANSNLVFRTYTTLDESNLQMLASMNLESNALYIYSNQEKDKHFVAASWDGRVHRYKIFRPGDDTAWLRPVEAPPVSDQLQAMVSQIQQALPNVLALTNKLAAVLDNAADATSNLNTTIVAAQPVITNFAVISAQLREPGSPMVWALGTNGNEQLQGALGNANSLLADTDTNLTVILLQLADLTSNLNAQVQANTNMLSGISKMVMDADSFVQGLKHHWLLRSAFKKENKTNAPAVKRR